jgi:putative hydrolase of the HAD superfamily
MIKAVLCDLGDTLINFHEIDVFKAFLQGARETYRYLAEELGLAMPPFRRYRWSQQWAIRWAYLKSKITKREFNSIDILKHSTVKLGIPVEEDKFEELAWRWYRPMADQAKIDPYALAMINDLMGRSLQLGIVSNTFVPPSALDRHLSQEKLLEYFPLRVYSCQVGVRKPATRIFDVALEKLQIAPDQAVFIGDSPKADIQGARQAGMFAILKANHPFRKFRPDHRTFKVDSLDQVLPIIDRINQIFPNPGR